MSASRTSVIGHHLIWTLYGHWLPNDPRGSGSSAVRESKFADLGETHRGRKPPHEQPSRQELKAFYRQAEPLLEFPRFWIDEAKRQAIATSIGEVVRKRPYTVWACAILSNHMHMVVRRHRDDGPTIWQTIADATADALRALGELDQAHPVWAARPYFVFLWSPANVRGRVAYVERNPAKEGLGPQRFDFVTVYDNWPLHQASRWAQ